MRFDLLTINGGINNDVIENILKLAKPGAAARLVLVINTLGGSPFIAYRSMQHLSAIYEDIDAVVVNESMSAGTLMCMGADTVYMLPGSSLGPLDLQVPHPNDGGQISSLDIRESTYDIFALTTRVTKQLYEQAVYDMKLGKNQAAKMAHESAVELLKPMVDKIDPFHLHASYRGASIGQKYAYILLASRMMKSKPEQARITSKILAEDYEMHAYAITMEEARDYLQLTVKNLVDLDVFAQIQPTLSVLPSGVTFTRIPGDTPPVATETKEEVQDDQPRVKPKAK